MTWKEAAGATERNRVGIHRGGEKGKRSRRGRREGVRSGGEAPRWRYVALGRSARARREREQRRTKRDRSWVREARRDGVRGRGGKRVKAGAGHVEGGCEVTSRRIDTHSYYSSACGDTVTPRWWRTRAFYPLLVPPILVLLNAASRHISHHGVGEDVRQGWLGVLLLSQGNCAFSLSFSRTVFSFSCVSVCLSVYLSSHSVALVSSSDSPTY